MVARVWTKRIGWAILVFFVVDVALGLWVGKKALTSMTKTDYFFLVLDGLTAWTGRFVWVIAAVWGVALAAFRGKPPKWLTIEEIVSAIVSLLPKFVSKLFLSIPAALALAATAPMLIWQGLTVAPALPSAGAILTTEDIVDNRKEIFVALPDRGEVLVYNADFIQRTSDVIEIGNQSTRGQPQLVAIAPRRGPNGEIYIVDAGSDRLVVLDRSTHANIGSINVGKAPRWMAITPDERKAYVTNEQPIPQGSISVVDLEKHQVTKTISGINCPEGMAMDPSGKRVYVITQCGAGQDPLFVVDTTTDTVIKNETIRGLAVGLSVAITPDGKKLYVLRGSFETRDRQTGQAVTNPAQVTVIDARQRKVLTSIPVLANSIAITPDGKYVLLGGDRRIDIVDATSDQVINTFPLGTSPIGIAITKDLRAYVWLPDEQRVLLVGLSGLLARSEVK
jgi:YVTN family beta-propeller protein